MKISRNCTKPQHKHHLSRWRQQLFAHKVNLPHPPLTVRDFSLSSGAQHFMRHIWREMGSPEGQDCLGKLGSCQSSELWRGITLCAWLCSSYALTKDKLTLISQKNKQWHQQRETPASACPQQPEGTPINPALWQGGSACLWARFDFPQWPQHCKTKTPQEEAEPFLGPAPHRHLF